MPDRTVRSIGFVGLGNMGTPMARRLVEAGFAVRANDAAPDAAERAAAVGAVPVDLGSAASADALVLMLPNSRVVNDVVGSLIEQDAIAPGLLVIDMSSSEPQSTRDLAARLAPLGTALIDAPVSGGVGGAERGTLTVMVGADDAELERARPLLSVLGTVRHAGGVGAGHAVKALNNLLSATHLLATAEAITAGERFGLDPDVMLAVFNGSSGRSGSTENKYPNFIRTGGFDSGFGLRLMLKDMRIAVGLADDEGVPARLGQDAVAIWAEAADELDPAADHTEIARWVGRRPRERDGRRPMTS